MKSNITFNTYPVAFHTPGGGEIQLLQYKKYLSENLFEISLFSQWEPNFNSINILHFFSCMLGSEHFLNYCKKLNIPIIVSPNLWITKKTKKHYPYKSIRQQFLIADKIICNSLAEIDLLSDTFNIEKWKFSLVYNAVSDNFLQPCSPNIFIDKYTIRKKFILNVANIEPRKNQLRLIQSVKQFPDYKLVIIGNIRNQKYYQQCLENGGDQLMYLGYLAHDSEELKSAYTACDLFALPSTLETPGLSALEAAALGARVLITEVGSAREYFNSDATYVNPLSVNSIKTGIAAALKLPKGKAKENIVNNFTWDKTIVSLEKIYLKNDVLPSNIFSTGFYYPEMINDEWAVWSNLNAKLYLNSNVLLAFEWTAAQASTVQVIINGIALEQTFTVQAQWQVMYLDLRQYLAQTGAESAYNIEFRVQHIDPSVMPADSRDLGIAIRKIEQISSEHVSTWFIDRGMIFETAGLRTQGFYASELTPEGWFAWSKSSATLYCKSGTLTFEWTVAQRSSINITIDNNIISTNIILEPNWKTMNIILNKKEFENDTYHTLHIKINSLDAISHVDSRDLGIAIRNVSFSENN